MAASGTRREHVVDALGGDDPVRRTPDERARVEAGLLVGVDEHGHELELAVPGEPADDLGTDTAGVELSQSDHRVVPPAPAITSVPTLEI